jgi:hypothetical protein
MRENPASRLPFHNLLTTIREEVEREEEIRMKCYRCKSEMVYEKFYGPHEHFWGWRCIFCGEIVDQVIWENRSGNVSSDKHKRR